MKYNVRFSIVSIFALLMTHSTNTITQKPLNIRVVVTGLHGVFLKPDTSKRHEILRKNWRLVGSMNLNFFGTAFKKGISSAIGFVQEPSAEQFLKNAHDEKLRSFIFQMAQAYTPVYSVVRIFEAIQNLGLPILIATNTGESIIKNLSKQEKFNSIFSLIDLEKSKATMIINDTQSIQMPNQQFFIDYIEQLNTAHNTHIEPDQILFIDSNLKNVDAAVEAGWNAIYFDGTSKTGYALKTSLSNLRSDIEQALNTQLAIAN